MLSLSIFLLLRRGHGGKRASRLFFRDRVKLAREIESSARLEPWTSGERKRLPMLDSKKVCAQTSVLNKFSGPTE